MGEDSTLNKIVDFFIPFKTVDQYGFTYTGFKQAYDTIMMTLVGIALITYCDNAVKGKDWSFTHYRNSVKNVAERSIDKFKTFELPLKEDITTKNYNQNN